ncbi:MAG: glycosyltransferase family 4 protein [Rhodospirillales bacterium]|nr:glycosyltransferase family 4 protein [Rhodospirillales bacterium]
MDNTPISNIEHTLLEKEPVLRVVINGIHAKSGGGVTYLKNILPILANIPNIEMHLFIHENQFELFYPVDEKVNVILLSFKSTFWNTLIWEQIAIPIKAWAMGYSVLFSPANYGPIMVSNHVILLRNAISVLKIATNYKQTFYWVALSLATLISFISSKKVIAVSHYAKKLMTFKLPKRFCKKCGVVYHGVKSPQLSDKQYDSLGVDILAVSDIYVQKNYYNLIRSFKILLKKRPKLRLIIIGDTIDYGYQKKLNNLIDELKIKKKVIFKGKVENEELIKYYKNCRVFVFPSLVETFGNTLLEAMSFGKAIACSETAAMPEVLRDCGVYFNPEDEFDIANKIELLLANDKLSIKLGRKAMQRADSFSWDNTAKDTYHILLEASNQKQNIIKNIR